MAPLTPPHSSYRPGKVWAPSFCPSYWPPSPPPWPPPSHPLWRQRWSLRRSPGGLGAVYSSDRSVHCTFQCKYLSVEWKLNILFIACCPIFSVWCPVFNAIYGVRQTIVGPPFIFYLHRLLVWRWMSCQHHRLSITLQILLTKTFNWLFLANSTDKYAHQWSSSPPAWSSTGSHICQLDLLCIADYSVFVDRI